MGAFLEQYGVAIFVLIIVGIMVLMASGVGATIEGLITQEVKRFTDKTVSENTNIQGNNTTKTVYNKKYIMGQTYRTIYLLINEDNNISVYQNESLLMENIGVLENNIITISNTGIYDGTYKFSNDKHKILAKNVDGIPENYCIAIEDNFCDHKSIINSNGGTWLDVKLDENNLPLLICQTCNETAYDYKLIDGVLYTKDIQIGDNRLGSCLDSEYNPILFGGYNALVWDKTLDNITIKSEIDGTKVTSIWGSQAYTDDDLTQSNVWNFEGIIEEWNNVEIDAYGSSYMDVKIKCTDGTVNLLK